MSKAAKKTTPDESPWDELNVVPARTKEQEELLVDSLLQLEPPKFQEKRRHKRALLYGTVAIYNSTGKVINRGLCVNLSISGAAFTSKLGPPPVGEIITCELLSRSKVSTITVKCKVIRVQPNSNPNADASEAQMIGVLFTELSRLAQKNIMAYLNDVFEDSGFNEGDI